MLVTSVGRVAEGRKDRARPRLGNDEVKSHQASSNVNRAINAAMVISNAYSFVNLFEKDKSSALICPEPSHIKRMAYYVIRSGCSERKWCVLPASRVQENLA